MGKGSSRRPMHVSREEYDRRYAGIDWATKGTDQTAVHVATMRAGKAEIELLVPVSDETRQIVRDVDAMRDKVMAGLGVPGEMLGLHMKSGRIQCSKPNLSAPPRSEEEE